MELHEKDFVEVSYTGKTQEGIVFDATDAQVAKQAGIYDKSKKYGAVVVCVGQGQLLPSLDKSLIGKNVSSSYVVSIAPEDAFGKKSLELIRRIPERKFKEQNITVYPGLQVFVDNQIGIVKTASSGRVLVDFNHPLSGHAVVYEVTIGAIITDTFKKVESLVALQFRDAKVTVENGAVTIKPKVVPPKEIGDIIEKHIKMVVPEITTVTWTA